MVKRGGMRKRVNLRQIIHKRQLFNTAIWIQKLNRPSGSPSKPLPTVKVFDCHPYTSHLQYTFADYSSSRWTTCHLDHRTNPSYNGQKSVWNVSPSRTIGPLLLLCLCAVNKIELVGAFSTNPRLISMSSSSSFVSSLFPLTLRLYSTITS